jgi:hypothetical protein
VALVACDLHATLGWKLNRAEAETLREAQLVAEWNSNGSGPLTPIR